MLIPKHKIGQTPLLPGHWRAVQRLGDKPDSPDRIIKFSCPLCGVEGELSDHEIDGDGKVSPSVVCPEDCGFHQNITLDDWDLEDPA